MNYFEIRVQFRSQNMISHISQENSAYSVARNNKLK